MDMIMKVNRQKQLEPAFNSRASKSWLSPCNAMKIVLFVLWGATITARAETTSSEKAARIDELVSRYQHCGYLNGAVLVAEHGNIIYEKGVGEANRELHTPNTPQTKFDIASITKQFTAVLVLQQVAKGNLRLQGTVSEYLPWYRKDSGERMTIEQLLRHTSGLPHDYDNPQFSESAEQPATTNLKPLQKSIASRH
jgi:CubicO group peptidase (beta-lactamase class C family)